MPQQCRNNKLLVHAAVVLLGIVLGRAARRRQNTAPASTPAAFVSMLLETPQPLLLATTRLQVDKFPRGTVRDARRSLNGALDVRAAKKRSPAFRALWRRRRRASGADARAGEAREAVFARNLVLSCNKNKVSEGLGGGVFGSSWVLFGS